MFFQTILLIVFEYNSYLFGLFFSYVIYHLFRFYQRVWSLPPGPIPLPIIGNILICRSKDTWDKVLRKQGEIYGPVFTIWLGPEPIVFICDLDLGRDVFSSNRFSGRHQSFLTRLFSNDKQQDVAFSSGETWHELRKVTYSAIGKYAKNEKLSLLTSDCVRHTVNDIISREGVDQEFSSRDYIQSLVMNIMAESVFGQSDLAVDKVSKIIKVLFDSNSDKRLFLWAYSSLVRLWDWKGVNQITKTFDDFKEFTKNIFQNHCKDYEQSIERDFCDALIAAKKEALKEGKQSLKYLTDDNLSMVIFDLFVAGVGTTVGTLQWIILFMTYYPEFQRKLRQEIENQIGDRIPIQEDRNRCHFVMAFISEALRFRNILPVGLPHTAIEHGKIGNYSILKGNGVFVFQDMILNDVKHWPNAHQFIPQRFIENGQYITRPKAFIPFGIGRRVCVGEKLAFADIFLIIVSFLQLTNEYDLVLGSNSGTDPVPCFGLDFGPAQFNVILKKRSHS